MRFIKLAKKWNKLEEFEKNIYKKRAEKINYNNNNINNNEIEQ